MKHRLIDFVKNCKILYYIYFFVMSITLKIMGIFLKANQKIVLFVGSGGRYYGGNVGPIYEEMLNDRRFDNWKFVWAFRNPAEISMPLSDRTMICKIDTIKYFLYALKAKCWITDVSIQRGLHFKNKGTIYINVWHGVPLKHIGYDLNGKDSFKLNESFELVLAEGTYDAPIMRKAFGLREDQVKITGYPRNDIMFDNTKNHRRFIRELYKISENKKIILYAPTYRDYNKNIAGVHKFDFRFNAEKFKKILGDEFVLLVRTHLTIQDTLELHEPFIDVSSYPITEHLLAATDILITDYSGILFDFSLLHRPIICFAYDLESYKEKRGLYVDLETFTPFPVCQTENEVYRIIQEMDYVCECKKTECFAHKCGLVYDHAAKRAVNAIYECISSNLKNEKGQ